MTVLIIIAIIALAIWWGMLRKRKTSLPENETSGICFHCTPCISEEILDQNDWSCDLESDGPFAPKSISAQIEIEYQDASGSMSTRLVQVRECDITNQCGYMIGFCSLRQAIRTFRIDRIQNAVDLETGEVIDDLPNWAKRRYRESPAYTIEKLLQEAHDGLRALFYIGKADGRFTKKEKQVFLDYCRRHHGCHLLEIKDIDHICAQLDIPSKQAYKLLCGRLAKKEENLRQAIMAAAEAMIATEKTIAAEEAEALNYLRKRLTTTSTA